jgi:hypothetical protein
MNPVPVDSAMVLDSGTPSKQKEDPSTLGSADPTVHKDTTKGKAT